MRNLKIFYLLFIILIYSYQPVNSQDIVTDHWETLIFYNDIYQYVSDANPGTDWNLLSYNDSAWLSGQGGIGYGDNDDNTIIEPAISLFLRKEFQITDTAKINEAILSIDYDDAFVAYINGTEIARSNIGTPGIPPAYNDLASGNHEAGNRETYRIYYQDIQNCLEQGNNLLAVQVHNVVANTEGFAVT